MTKKWLYSVALGALLMAGEAFGITVHEVLSNGFWSTEQRGTFKVLDKIVSNSLKLKKKPTIKYEDGSKRERRIYIYSGPSFHHTRWKQKNWRNWIVKDESRNDNDHIVLTATRGKDYKEKTITDGQTDRKCIMETGSWADDFVSNSLSTYTVKPLKKGMRPMGPLVVYDWFPDAMSAICLSAQFYGTEQTAVTNIVSDNEAYITRTINQTGWIDSCTGFVVNEGASLQRTYNTHITTDDNHVYVDQAISEVCTNNFEHNEQDEYRTQYVANFNKGRWKSSTETITLTQNSKPSDWYLRYIKRDSQNTR